MKKITLEEFAELAKNDEALKEKMIQIATMKGVDAGKQTDELTALAIEYGYELEKNPILDMEALSDEDLENVAGGVKAKKTSDNPWCEWLMETLGYDINLCY